MSDAQKSTIRKAALTLGFERVGFCAAEPTPHAAFLDGWLAGGKHGTMEWLGRNPHWRKDIRTRYEWAKSFVVLSMDYSASEENKSPEQFAKRTNRRLAPRAEERRVDGHSISDDQPVAGAPCSGLPRIARYAQGPDYHDTYAAPLKQFEAEIKRIGGPDTRAMSYQDTGPFLERAIAQQAGLGWVGKNTMLIDTKHGSWTLLALVVTSLDLPPDVPGADHCGTCTRCLQACPTDAFPAPYQLDATRCISYLTIEHKGPIDETLRAGIGDWVFGCDICNEVCPWNRETDRLASHGQRLPAGLTLSRILTAKPEHLIKRIAGTPLVRTGGGTGNPVGHLKRNAAIVAGNARDEQLLPALEQALQTDDEVVQEAAIWALEQYGAGARSVMARAQRYVGNKDLRERVIATLQRQQEPGAVRDANEPQARTASRGTTG